MTYSHARFKNCLFYLPELRLNKSQAARMEWELYMFFFVAIVIANAAFVSLFLLLFPSTLTSSLGAVSCAFNKLLSTKGATMGWVAWGGMIDS